MNNPATDIKDILVADENLDLTFGTNLFISREPTSPDNCVTVYDTAGRGDDLNYNKDEKYNRPGIRIRVRNSSYIDGWNIAWAIKETLHGMGNVEQGGSFYTLIQCTAGPSGMKWDENNRVLLEMDFSLQRRPVVLVTESEL